MSVSSERASLAYYHHVTQTVWEGLSSGAHGEATHEELLASWVINYRAAQRMQRQGIVTVAAPKSGPRHQRDIDEVRDVVRHFADGTSVESLSLVERRLAKQFETRVETSQLHAEHSYREVSVHLLVILGTASIGMVLGYSWAIILSALAIMMGSSGVFLLLRQGHDASRHLVSRSLLLASGFVLLLELLLFMATYALNSDGK